MTNFDKIKKMSEEEFVEWLEDTIEAYVSFWISPSEMCDFSHREEDKKMQLRMLKKDYDNEIGF